MQRGLTRPVARARPARIDRRKGAVGVLLLGLVLPACAGTGQFANLTESPRVISVAIESIEGAPPAVFRRFVSSLKAQAASQQISVVPAGEADYRLRGYLAAHGQDGTISVSWVWDAYGPQGRTFRLRGEEQEKGDSPDSAWAAMDDGMLERIARAGMQQFAAIAAARPASGSSSGPTHPLRTALGWFDDWAPEASGIFRILQRAPSSAPEIAADASRPLPADEIPLPNGRPLPSDLSGSTLAFALD